jgi:hypothetical protein
MKEMRVFPSEPKGSDALAATKQASRGTDYPSVLVLERSSD